MVCFVDLRVAVKLKAGFKGSTCFHSDFGFTIPYFLVQSSLHLRRCKKYLQHLLIFSGSII